MDSLRPATAPGTRVDNACSFAATWFCPPYPGNMSDMEIHATNDFAADIDEVFAMLTDAAFLREVCLATDPMDHSVEVVGTLTRTRRVMPTPSVAQALAGPTMAVIDEIDWHPATAAARTGRAHISVEGLPAELNGTVRLVAGGRGAILTYLGDLVVKVPLLGPSLARQAAPLLLEALEIQQRVGDEYLAR